MLCPRVCGKSENSCNLYRFTAVTSRFFLHSKELERIVEVARLVPTFSPPGPPFKFLRHEGGHFSATTPRHDSF